MPKITGICKKFDQNGSIVEMEVETINLRLGDRVMFVDNSYLDYCSLNKRDDYAISFGRALSLNEKALAKYSCSYFGVREIEMPIMVVADNGDIVYCNPLNIRKV